MLGGYLFYCVRELFIQLGIKTHTMLDWKTNTGMSVCIVMLR